MRENERFERLESKIRHLEKEVHLLKSKLHVESNIEDENTEESFHQTESENVVLMNNEKDVETNEVVVIKEEEKEEEAFVLATRQEEKELENELAKELEKESKKEPEKDSVDWEHLIGRVWLPRIFIFVLLIGVLWGFKAAVDYGIITDPIKVIAGMVLGFGLIWIGEKQIKEHRIALGQVLLGGSIVILLLSTIAGHLWYGLIPPLLAFGLNVLWTTLGIFFSKRHTSQPIAVVAALGGFLTPFLVNGNVNNDWYLVIYMTMLYGSLLYFAIMNKFRVLYYVSFIILPIALGLYSLIQGEGKIVAIGYLLQHILLFVVFVRNQIFLNDNITTLFTSFIMTVSFAGIQYGESFNIWLISFFIVYGIVSFLFIRTKTANDIIKNKLAVVLSIASFSLMLYFFEVIDDPGTRAMIVTVQGLISLYLGIRLRNVIKIVSGALVYVPGLLMSFSKMIIETMSIETASWMVAIGSLFVLSFLLYKRKIVGYEWALFVAFFTLLFFIPQILFMFDEWIIIFYTLESLMVIYLGVRLKKEILQYEGYGILLITGFQTFFLSIFDWADVVAWIVVIGSYVVLHLFYNKKKLNHHGLFLFFCFFFTLLLGVELLNEEVTIIFITLLSLLVIKLGDYVDKKIITVEGYVFFFISIFLSYTQDIREVLSIDTLVWIANISIIFVVYKHVKARLAEENKWITNGLMSFVIFIGLVFLTIQTNLITADLPFEIQRLCVSVVWVTCAIIGMVYGRMKNVKGARYAGVILLFSTLLKVIFIDLPTVSIVIKAVLFIGLGAVGLVISRMFYRK